MVELSCKKCGAIVTFAYEDSVKTKFYKCPTCGIIDQNKVHSVPTTKAELKKLLKKSKAEIAQEQRLKQVFDQIDQEGFRTCKTCQYYLTLDCPISAGKTKTEALELYNQLHGTCFEYKKKTKIKLEKELEMKETLDCLYEKYTFKCPTDTEEILGEKDGQYIAFECVIKHELETLYTEDLKRIFVAEVLAHIQRANYIEREEINKFRNKIPLQNGLFDFETKTLESFDLIPTIEQIYTFKLNAEYDPKAKCSIFLKFVSQVVRKEDIPLLQEIMGYCILPKMPHHKLFWWYGKGRNGKGRIIKTLEFILGKDNCSSLDISEFKEGRRFSLCQLYGKLLNVSNEPQLTKYGIQTNVLKKISGEDTIRAELKGKNKRLIFTNIAKPIILGNRFPKVEDNTAGWWERVSVLEFPNSFLEGENQIVNIEKTWIPDEINGIFNWMLEGLYRLQKNGTFTKSKSTEETKNEFVRQSDPFRAWLNDCCTFFAVGKTTRHEARDSYEKYCDELGIIPDKPKPFYNKLNDTQKIRPYRTTKMKKTERGWQGIILKKQEEIEGQTKIVSRMSGMSSATSQEYIKNKNNKINKELSPDIADTPDMNKTFYIKCFDCGVSLGRHEVYSFGGNHFCRKCRLKIEDQKKKG